MQGALKGDNVKLKDLLQQRRTVKKNITKHQAAKREKCQAQMKASKEQYSRVDSQQLPPGFIGAQLLPHAPPYQPCSPIDNDLLRLPASFSQCASILRWPPHPQRSPLRLQQRSGSSSIHYWVRGPAYQDGVLLLGVAGWDMDMQTVAMCPMAFCLLCCTLPCCTLLCAASERSMMHAEALDETVKEGQARRGGDPETPNPLTPAKGRCPYTEAKGPSSDPEDDEEDGSGEAEPEEWSKAGFLVCDSEEEGQVCKPTVICADVHAQ